MSSSVLDGQEALNALKDLGRGEGWLLSIKVSAHTIELVGDFSNIDARLDGKKLLNFHSVSELHLIYNQSMFGGKEDDISTIDSMKIRDSGNALLGASRIIFELSYGSLEFIFDSVEIKECMETQ